MALATKTKRKPPVHYKKRQAGHHRHSKVYIKSYWPYLPMLLLVVGGLLLSNLWAAKNHVLGAQSDFSAQTFLTDTNAQRTSDNEASLSLNDQLTSAAQAKAADMSAKDYWAHDSPSGQTPWDFLTAAGYNYADAGENLAYGFGNAGQVISGWMNSPEHRANILDGNYCQVGFGIASSPNFLGKGPATIIVAEYGCPVQVAANITFKVPHQSSIIHNTQPSQPDSQLVSRLALVSSNQPSWLSLGVAIIASCALTIFLIRHALRLRRLLIQGELFVVQHPAFDIAIVFVFMAGYILTRASGVIR